MKTMTAAELKKLTVAQLKEIAADLFDADDLKGLKKANFVELLNDHFTKQAAEDAEDEVDDTDDEIDDEEPSELIRKVAIVLPDEDDEEDDLVLPDDDELDDDEVDDEPRIKIVAETGDTPKTKTAPPEPSGETLTAKQVATRIGTDAKTLRKFFRSPASTTKAVGQGGRYEFAKDDLPAIQEEFAKWNSGKTARTPRAKAEKPTRATTPVVEEVDEADEELELDGPSDDELDDEDDDLELDFDDELDD